MKLAQQLKELISSKASSSSTSSVQNVSMSTGIATTNSADSEDGKTVFVERDAVVISEDDAQAVEMPTTAEVKAGDIVQITTVGAANSTRTSTVTGVIGRGQEQANEVTEAVDTANTAVTTAKDAATITITSTHGLVFKDSAISTTLMVVVFRPGGGRIEDQAALTAAFGSSAHIEWRWRRDDADEWSTILSSDSRLSDDGFSFTVSPEDVNDRTSFEASIMVD
jgi:hypothetical protein